MFSKKLILENIKKNARSQAASHLAPLLELTFLYFEALNKELIEQFHKHKDLESFGLGIKNIAL